MTKKEVAEMLDYAQACYPEVRFKEQKKVLDVWADVFSGYDAKSTMDCMKKVCRISKYFPSVADVMAEVRTEREKMRGYIQC